MLHFVKKCASKRGSALFMVISTMTALLISCMAMYYSMTTSSSSQFAVYNQLQANQSAQSVADIIQAVLNGGAAAGSANATAADKLADKMQGLSVGESIQINPGDKTFASLDPNNPNKGDLLGDVDNLGAYSVTITLTGKDENGNNVYDISAVSSVEGNKDVVHLEYVFPIGSDDNPLDDNNPPSGVANNDLFSTTGATGNDSYLDGGGFVTDLFLDNELVYIGTNTNNDVTYSNRFLGDFSVTGTLKMQGGYVLPLSIGIGNSSNDYWETTLFKYTARPATWAIGNDFVMTNGELRLYKGSKVMVRGDMYLSGGSIKSINENGKNNTDGEVYIYVLGDLIIDDWLGDYYGVNMYVAGNVIFGEGKNGATNGKFKNLYVNGNSNGASTNGSWTNNAGSMSVDKAANEIINRTIAKLPKKWIVEPVKDTSKTIKIKLNGLNNSNDGVNARKSTFTIAYDSSCETAGTADHVGKEFIIDGFQGAPFADRGNYDWSPTLSIVLDTGNNENNILRLTLKPYLNKNGEYVGSGSSDATMFMWFPEKWKVNGNTTTFRVGNDGYHESYTILVKGRGTVVIDMADGMDYQDHEYQQFMHYSWFKILGGREYDVDGVHTYNSQKISQGDKEWWINGVRYRVDSMVKYLIHNDCHKGDGCGDYTTSASTRPCDTCKQMTVKNINCPKHGVVCSYCETCEGDKPTREKLERWNSNTPDPSTGQIEGFCDDRLDKEKVKNMLGTFGISENDLKYQGTTVYPNSNIFLYTLSDTTQFYFSAKSTNKYENMNKNSFYGFVYAPYITFYASGRSGYVSSPRLVGGITAADIVFHETYTFETCYPDKMPSDLAELMTGSANAASGVFNRKVPQYWKPEITVS